MAYQRGIFMSFEGTEGSGKSTLIKKVSILLDRSGFEVVQTREPGGTALGERIRELLLGAPSAADSLSSMNRWTELMLCEAARAEHVAQVIQPALARKAIVLCDRFTDSTLAYQAHARGLPWKDVEKVNQMASLGVCPDLTVFLDIDPEVGLRRAQDPNRFEAEGLAFQKRVRAGFLKARTKNRSRWFVLRVQDQSAHSFSGSPPSSSPDALADALFQEISRRFKRRLAGLRSSRPS